MANPFDDDPRLQNQGITNRGPGQDRNLITRSYGSLGARTPPPPRRDRVDPRFPQGTANYYEDSLGSFLGSLQQKRSLGDTLTNFLQGFQGEPGDIEQWLKRMGPFLSANEATRLEGSDAMRHLEDQGNWDKGALAGYGSAAGQMGQKTRAATASANQKLAASGLGRGSARAALQQQGMQNLTTQQGDLWARTFQQAQQNRWNSAQGLVDTHRAISQMALGQQFTPRENQDGGGSNNSWIGPALTSLATVVAAVV